MKIVTIIGARPQFIKAAVLSRVILQTPNVTEVLVHTGQHYDANMSDVFFNEMEIPHPQYHFNIQSKFHGEMTGLMMIEIEKVVLKENSDWILVYGDTNSTLAGALIASKLHIKLAHVEAGLRSFNTKMPEEINRILTDRISNILFCPTDNAVKNLEDEGYRNFTDKKIIKTGDIMLDASLFYAEKDFEMSYKLPKKFALCTVHRAENTDNEENLKIIFQSLDRISENCPIVLPLHPRTKSKLESINPNYIEEFNNISFLPPFSYFEMLWCLKNCEFVITDSGGLQKEAYFFKKKCLTLRDQTEWVELVIGGYNFLSIINEDKILENLGILEKAKPNFKSSLYGNGNTAELILEELINYSK